MCICPKGLVRQSSLCRAQGVIGGLVCCGTGTSRIASHLPFVAWHEVNGDQTFAAAILDRLGHSAHPCGPDGRSMRKTQPKTVCETPTG